MPTQGQVTKWTIRRFKLHTWAVASVLCALGFLFGWGFGALVVGYLLYEYIQNRRALLMELEWAAHEGEVGRIRKEADQAISKAEALRKQWLVEDVAGADPFLCRTCQQPYSRVTAENLRLCVNLREVFSHDPHAEPPPQNPFRWYWFTVNGYRMPPADWPADKFWLPDNATAPDPATAMAAEGREYYTRHANPLWEAGFGNPRDWYERKTTIA